MDIKENVLKYYLRNCLFINGTSYAGKSTMCKLLAEKYELHLCEENYNSDVIFKVINQKDQPNLSYFNHKESWEAYLNRPPREYESWMRGNSEELIGFEIAELIRLSQDRKVIVDTNIPLDILEKITDYHQVAIMVSEPDVSAEKFFKRPDAEKKFLLEQIGLCKNPQETYSNFIACMAQVNSNEYLKYKACDYFKIERVKDKWLDKESTLAILAKHFRLTR
ncbi:hypothetical protein EZV73_04585 [Acidaminobacter sp. JC074]|uniref:hypothetical protein n=1 Tax=Acidaminobacter sp. JC074 TaxID=2530199 RepID=UPI001F0DDDDC|nr:hypothetical protein [Acidaminobacter sp. JC074]MCH4886831.1 hypothetical protein [Acidaminobacter sp. JC074]